MKTVPVAPVATAATGVSDTSFTANWNAFAGASYYLLDVSLSSSFSTFVLQNTVTTATSYVVTGLTSSTTYYYRVRAAINVDSDVAGFVSRVYTAGGTLSYTEVTATETLVADLKGYGIWSAMKAIYPMVGASAAACAQNLKSSSFTGTFTSGWTFASTGVTPNGTSAYFDTTLVPNTSLTFNSASFSAYSRNNFTPTADQSLGCSSISTFRPLVGITFLPTKAVEGLVYDYVPPDYMVSATGQNLAGMFLTTRTSSSSSKLFRNTTQIASATTNNQTTQPKS
ncbi:MAG: hypothetical protein EBR30_21630 [Cytophagia bacterium]|nr:hypothetical protein [Cytophagia bacterium]